MSDEWKARAIRAEARLVNVIGMLRQYMNLGTVDELGAMKAEVRELRQTTARLETLCDAADGGEAIAISFGTDVSTADLRAILGRRD